MFLINKLNAANIQIVRETDGEGWHLQGKNGNIIFAISVVIDNVELTFTTNPSGCGSLILSGNINLNMIEKERFEELCKIIAKQDAGTLFAVLSSDLRHHPEHQTMLDYGFIVTAEYPNIRHNNEIQRLYMKITTK